MMSSCPLKWIFSRIYFLLILNLFALQAHTQPQWELVWSDEFEVDGVPDTSNWKYEEGFVRNEELQWYQHQNAWCAGGKLIIEARNECRPNPLFRRESSNWRFMRDTIRYTSASLNTRGLHHWLYGRFEVCAKIDTSMGSWPAIWTLGIKNPWPSNGEIDIMEFYRVNNQPTILANAAWGTAKQYVAQWDSERVPLSSFLEKDPLWPSKYHAWRMDWNEKSIQLFLDDELLNTINLETTINPNGFNPFQQSHYLLLNLTVGANGGNPSNTHFPIRYEIEYVRVYQLIH
jgi:beta-glucanase (GH16 family)